MFHKTILMAVVLLTTAISSFAQRHFTQQLQEQVAGQGTVVLTQDARMDSIINGEIALPKTVESNKTVSVTSANKTTKAKVNGTMHTASSGANGSAVVREKRSGFRVQVFFGGNKRADQTKAQQIAAKVQARYPELTAYTTFESPHWKCRVGDFATREEAFSYSRRLRASGFCPDATVVRSEVYIIQ